MPADPAKDTNFKEDRVDKLRAQKDDELDRYRRMAERAAATIANDVTVAVDDPRVQQAVQAAGFDAVMTNVNHSSGSDRTMEVARINAWPDEDIVVNVQGDEPICNPNDIKKIVNL